MAVISDLHARIRPDGSLRSTWARQDEKSPGENPLAGLVEYVEESGLKADVVLCPGDLCDQADWPALRYAWGALERVAKALEASEIIATVGNHDIDSHGMHKPASIAHGPRSRLTNYPARDASVRKGFWKNRVATVRGGDWRVVVLNSALMRYLAKGERDTGLVDDAALAAIRSDVSNDSGEVNVLLCHHHPQRWTRLDRQDQSEMANGTDLVDLLADAPQTWMMVHGHRHEPHMDYLSGGGDSAIRLACGSVGARLHDRLAAHARNQIHIIEFAADHARALGLATAGIVRSHTWRPVTGWGVAGDRDGLPSVAGFGFRYAGASLAQRLVEHAREHRLPSLERNEMLKVEARLDYLLPSDVRKLQEALKSHKCKLDLDEDGRLSRLKLPVIH